MFFNHEKLFQLALNLEEPWFVKRIEFNKDAGELHIYIDFHRGASFPCPVCGGPAKTHDTEEQTWRHLNFFQYKAFLHSRTPRSKCPVHGVRLVKVPWSRPGSDFTLLFEAMVLAIGRPDAGCGRRQARGRTRYPALADYQALRPRGPGQGRLLEG